MEQSSSQSPELIRELFLIAIKNVVSDVGQGLLDLEYISLGENSSLIISKANHAYYPHDFVSEFEEPNQGLINTKEFCELNVLVKPVRVVISFKTFKASLQIHQRELSQILNVFRFSELDNLWHLSEHFLDILEILREVDDGIYQICCGFTKTEVGSKWSSKFLLRLNPHTQYISAKCEGVFKRCIPRVTKYDTEDKVYLPRCQSCKNWLNESKRSNKRKAERKESGGPKIQKTDCGSKDAVSKVANLKRECGNLFLNARSLQLIMKLSKLTVTLNKDQSSELKAIVSTISSKLLDNLNEVINVAPDFTTRQTFRRVWKKDCETRREIVIKTGFKDYQWSVITFRLALAVYVRSPAGFKTLRNFRLLQLPNESSLGNFTPNTFNKPELSDGYILKQKALGENQENHQLCQKHPLDEVKVIGKVLWNSSKNKLMGLAMMRREMSSMRDIYFILNNENPEETPYYAARNQKMMETARGPLLIDKTLKFKNGLIDPEYLIKKEVEVNSTQEYDELDPIPHDHDEVDQIPQYSKSKKVLGGIVTSRPINEEIFLEEPCLNNESFLPLVIHVKKDCLKESNESPLNSKQETLPTRKGTQIDKGTTASTIINKESKQSRIDSNQETLPTRKKALPTRKKALPTRKKALPTRKKALPTRKKALIDNGKVAFNPINKINFSEEPYLNNESFIPLVIHVKKDFLEESKESRIDSNQETLLTRKEALIDKGATASNLIIDKKFSEEPYLNNESFIPLVINVKEDFPKEFNASLRDSNQGTLPTKKEALIDKDALSPINKKNSSEEPYLNNESIIPLVINVKEDFPKESNASLSDSNQGTLPTKKEALIDIDAFSPINEKNSSEEPYLNNESIIPLVINVKEDFHKESNASRRDSNQGTLPTKQDALIDKDALSPINEKTSSEGPYLNNETSIPLVIHVKKDCLKESESPLNSKQETLPTTKETQIDKGTTASTIINKKKSAEPYLNNDSLISFVVNIKKDYLEESNESLIDSDQETLPTEKEALIKKGKATRELRLIIRRCDDFSNTTNSKGKIETRMLNQSTKKLVEHDHGLYSRSSVPSVVNVKKKCLSDSNKSLRDLNQEKLLIEKGKARRELRLIIRRCDDFSNTTSTKGKVKRRTLIDSTKKLTKGDYRSYSTRYKKSLNQHKEINFLKIYKCDNCSYSSHRKESLNQHKLIHSSEKKFKCDQCPFASYFKHSLRSHNLCHSMEYRFKCSECSYKCKSKPLLSKHKNLHSLNVSNTVTTQLATPLQVFNPQTGFWLIGPGVATFFPMGSLFIANTL